MAGGPSVYVADKLLNKSLKGTDFSAPGLFWVALFTTAAETYLRSNTIASANEVLNSNSYARQQVLLSNITVASSGVSLITVDIIFPSATGAWGTSYQAALMDAQAHGTGNIWYFGPLSSPASIQQGDVLKIPASSFTFSL